MQAFAPHAGRSWHDRGMCVGHDASLPALPVGPHAVEGTLEVLEAGDGNRFNAYVAVPDRVTGPAMLVLPDVRGLFAFYQDLACQFASHGFPSLAMDYFGRTAGTSPRSPDFPFMDHIAHTTAEGITADIAASVARLRRHADVVYAVGFCFGGTMAWSAATHGHGLAGVVGFYGRPDADRPAGDGPIWDRCHLIEGRVLSLFGGADPSIPQAKIDRFDAALRTAGVDFETVVYSGAPHSFFDRSQGDFVEQSRHAWDRIVSFVTH